MKNILITIGVLLFVVFGILLSLIALYAAPDEQVHFLEASYIWLGDAIALFGLLLYFRPVQAG
jgi:hypothetical protein